MQAMLSKQDSDTAMGRLFKRIAELTGGDFDTIIHIGAGADADLYDYQQLGFDRLILVEGDAESAEELRAAVHGRDGVEVIEQVVAPQADRVMWHRYNLPALNGVLPPGELHTLYPRLRVIGRERVQATSLQELLERATLNPAGRNLLFLDVPGTEDALLANVPEGLLHAFEWIAVHGNQCAYYEGSAEIDASVTRLKKHGFRLEALDSETDLNWPIALLQRDKTLLENKKLHAKIEDLTGTIETYATSELAQQVELSVVSAERDEHAKFADEREKQAYALTLERAYLVAQLAKSQAELKAVTEASATQQRLATEQQDRIGALSQQCDEQAEHVAGLQTQLERFTHAWDEQEEQLSQLRVQADRACATQERFAADTQSHLDQAIKDRTELLNQVAQLQGQIGAMANEKVALETLVTDRQKQISDLSLARDNEERWHFEYKQQCDGLGHEKTQLQVRNDELEQQLGAAQRKLVEQKNSADLTRGELAEAQKQLSNLRTNRRETEHRQRLVDEEMVKAETQLELIKDILLRGKAF